MGDSPTSELKVIADEWFDIYNISKNCAQADMNSLEILELVDGYDNHGSLIYDYNAMWDYIEKNRDKYEKELTPKLKKIADKWFKIYVALQKGAGLNMMSPKITKLVGGRDNHVAIIYNYTAMNKYMHEKKKIKTH